jgi:hypothetical protein
MLLFQGDSGGPLQVMNKDGRYEVIGMNVLNPNLNIKNRSRNLVYTRITKCTKFCSVLSVFVAGLLTAFEQNIKYITEKRMYFNSVVKNSNNICKTDCGVHIKAHL